MNLLEILYHSLDYKLRKPVDNENFVSYRISVVI